MHHIRRWSVSVFVVVMLATSSVVVAEDTLDGRIASDAGGAAFFAALQAPDLNPDLRTLYGYVRRAMADGIEALAERPPKPLPSPRICVHLVGTGGTTPRLDGGGNLLASMSSLFDPQQAIAHPSQERIRRYRDGTHLYVVDEFSIEALALSLRGLIGRPDVARDPNLGPALDPLWDAMYGYRIDLVGDPERPELTSVPHGHLVAYHVLSQLPRGSTIENVRMSPNELRVEVDVEHARSGTMKIHFVGIKFAQLGSIGVGMKELADEEPGAVILSWGLVDCLLVAGYEALPPDSPYGTIMEYFAATIRAKSGFERYLRDVCEEFVKAGLIEVLGFEPNMTCGDAPVDHLVGLAAVVAVAGFSEFAQAQIEWEEVYSEQHEYFAAAGNQGLGFPMPPAAWPGVIGVEACAAEREVGVVPSSTKASFSNVGSFTDTNPLRELGAWFQSPERSGTEPLGYWGTSFAAPTAALRSLAAGAPFGTCPE